MGIQASRGCPYQCTFCEAHQIWSRKVRFRNPKNIIKEIKECTHKYQSKAFRFQDDSFTVNRKNVMELCQLIINDKLDISWTCLSRADLVDDELLSLMKRAGCNSISFGIESGSQKIRDLIKKGINEQQIYETLKLVRKYGIRFSCCFMIGLPYETKGDIEQSLRLIKKLRPDFTNVCTFTPYPGSAIYDDCVKQGLIDENIDWGKYSHHSFHNHFVNNITEKDFHHFTNKIIKTADYLNVGISIPYFKSRFKVKWKSYVKNPFIFLHNLLTFGVHIFNSFKKRIIILIKTSWERDFKKS